MNLHDLIHEFQKIEGAQVGKGYLHPNDPQTHLEEITEYFINKYPFLQADSQYIEFLKVYAGAHIEQPPSQEDFAPFNWIVDVYGFFFNDMRYIFEDETSIDDHVNKDGYLLFCESIYGNLDKESKIRGVNYYMNIEMNGIYQYISRRGIYPQEKSYDLCCEDFLSWLELFVKNDGITFTE